MIIYDPITKNHPGSAVHVANVNEISKPVLLHLVEAGMRSGYAFWAAAFLR